MILAQRGYYEKDKLLQAHLKRGFFLVHCSLVEKKYRMNPDEFWPIDLEEKESTTDRLLKRFYEAKATSQALQKQTGWQNS